MGRRNPKVPQRSGAATQPRPASSGEHDDARTPGSDSKSGSGDNGGRPPKTELTRTANRDGSRGARQTPSRRAVWRSRVPRVAVWYARIVGVLSIISAVSIHIQNFIAGIPDDVYLAIWFIFGTPSIGFGTMMLLLSTALRRHKRSAWWVLLGVLVFLGPISTYAIDLLLVSPADAVQVSQIPPYVLGLLIGQLLLISLLIWSYREFPAKGDPTNPSFALGIFCGLLALSAVLGTTLVASTDRNPDTGLGNHLVYTLQRGIASTVLWQSNSGVDVPHWVNVLLNILGSALLLLTMYAFFRPRRRYDRLGPADEKRLRALLERNGEIDSLGYFALRRDKSVVFSATGKAAIAYRVVGGVSLAAADPIGDPEAWPGAIEAWLEEARAHAWVPAVMGASEQGGIVYARYGLDALELGDEAIVETDSFSLEGRAMRVIRQAYNRVRRAGYTTRIRRHRDIGEDEMAEIVELSERWRDGAERGFSMALSRLADPADGDCLMVECLDSNGTPRAVLSFVPWGSTGLSLDLMRRQRDSDNGLFEFMIIEVIKQAERFGVRRLSLNFAMFRSVFERGGRIGAGPFLRMWRRVLLFFSRWYQIESLYRANAKYRPRWEPRYVCFPSGRELLRVGLAMGRAEGFVTLPAPRPLRRLAYRIARRSRLARAAVARSRRARRKLVARVHSSGQ